MHPFEVKTKIPLLNFVSMNIQDKLTSLRQTIAKLQAQASVLEELLQEETGIPAHVQVQQIPQQVQQVSIPNLPFYDKPPTLHERLGTKEEWIGGNDEFDEETSRVLS